MSKYILSFKDISINNLAEVGGKNASLGEMTRKLAAAGISIPNGFAITALVTGPSNTGKITALST